MTKLFRFSCFFIRRTIAKYPNRNQTSACRTTQSPRQTWANFRWFRASYVEKNIEEISDHNQHPVCDALVFSWRSGTCQEIRQIGEEILSFEQKNWVDIGAGKIWEQNLRNVKCGCLTRLRYAGPQNDWDNLEQTKKLRDNTAQARESIEGHSYWVTESGTASIWKWRVNGKCISGESEQD